MRLFVKSKKAAAVISVILTALCLHGCSAAEPPAKAEMAALYGENRTVEGRYDIETAVKCENGVFLGRTDGDVISFKGIPYAKAPVGELRWKPPVEAEQSEEVREAYYFGLSPVQTEWPSEVGSYYPQGEDCLTLSIWANRSSKAENKSVMVFFHGGSYGWGAVSDPIYDGTNLVEKYDDIILVSVEYRLGIFGFIDFSDVPGGEEYKESGNLGLLDQVCALRWIQNNIESFGGDPANVTIFGESAGAGSVSLIPLMEGTKGLFNRVIAESGSVALTYGKDECENLTNLLLEKSGCKNMDELNSLREEELAELNRELNDYNNFPERDGVVLPEDLYEAYESGAGSFEMLIGTNADESRYWINEMGYYAPGIDGEFIYRHALPVMFENNIKRLDAVEKAEVDLFISMQNGAKVWKLTEFYNEILFRLPAMKQAALHASHGNNVYSYYWTFPGENKTIGACHAIELAYVFNNPQATIYTGGKYNEKLADAIQDMWVDFARNGNPSTDEYIWEPYTAENRVTMIIGDEIKQETDIKEEQRALIEPLLGYYFNGCYSQLSLNVPQIYRIIAQAAAVVLIPVSAAVIIIKTLKKKRSRKTAGDEI